MGITPLSGIVFMVTWAMTLFVAERREYISFDAVTVFMVLMLASTVILLSFNISTSIRDYNITLSTGAVLTALNIYLVYIDSSHGKNFYQESRMTHANLEILSSKLSEILSAEHKREHLLSQVTQECVPFLELEDCVIYLYNEDKDRLVQMATYQKKYDGTNSKELVNPFEIKPGDGVVGQCYQTAKSIYIEETKRYPEYVQNGDFCNSELAAPIFSNGKVCGVIDSEHSMKGFFKERHLQAFHIMASFCGIKITEYYAKESIKLAQIAKQEADRYKELEELKSRFITNISHDLKTPLSLIKAPASQIAEITTEKQVKKLSNYILKNTEHLLKVVNQLLQLNRVDKGLNELYLEEVNVKYLLNKLSKQYMGLAEKNNVSFSIHLEQVILCTDAFRLEQIIHNLVHNAFRYTNKNGSIKLTAVQEMSFLKISVEDNGPGISQEIQARVFDRFFKADENNHEGTGIGLSLVKEYAQSLNGKVEIKSEPGQGTTFLVEIPIQSAAKKIEEIGDLEQHVENGMPVMLVVEDHADLNNFICTCFEQDFHCISAFDGQEALLKIEEQKPDIIITDLMMPHMDGGTFVREVKSHEKFGFIPIIVLSAKEHTESKIDLYKIGASNYLVKPFEINELKSIVENVISQRKKLKELFHTQFLNGQTVNPEQNSSEDTEESESKKLLRNMTDHVKENLDNPQLSVKSISEELGIGRNRFQKEVKELTGLTPVELVRSIRLNEAKKMLENRQLSISEIAFSAGFNNLSYFTRSFKNEFNVLPSEWRLTLV